MRKAIAIILASLMSAGVTAPELNPAQTDTRTIAGEVYSIAYPDDENDFAIVTIRTEDGNEWIVEDYVAPRFTPLAVTFDTNGTADKTDDKIIRIVSVWNA